MRADGIRIGLSAFGLPASDFVALTVAAEAAGFDSIWHAEHVVVPRARISEHPGDETSPRNVTSRLDDDHVLTDPFTVLGAAAARTSRIELMTGMYLAALRPPLVTARATITLHELSRGRFSLGVATGWLREEFEAVGVPFSERGPRLNEILDILVAAWSGREHSYRGQYFGYADVQMSPEPVPIPLILGGHSPVALRRAAARGDGWFTSGSPGLDEVRRLREQLAQLRRAAGRTGPFDIHVRPADATPKTIDDYTAAGFDRFVLWANEVCPAPGTGQARWSGLPEAAAGLGLVPVPATATHPGGEG